MIRDFRIKSIGYFVRIFRLQYAGRRENRKTTDDKTTNTTKTFSRFFVTNRRVHHHPATSVDTLQLVALYDSARDRPKQQSNVLQFVRLFPRGVTGARHPAAARSTIICNTEYSYMAHRGYLWLPKNAKTLRTRLCIFAKSAIYKRTGHSPCVARARVCVCVCTLCMFICAYMCSCD